MDQIQAKKFIIGFFCLFLSLTAKAGTVVVDFFNTLQQVSVSGLGEVSSDTAIAPSGLLSTYFNDRTIGVESVNGGVASIEIIPGMLIGSSAGGTKGVFELSYTASSAFSLNSLSFDLVNDVAGGVVPSIVFLLNGTSFFAPTLSLTGVDNVTSNVVQTVGPGDVLTVRVSGSSNGIDFSMNNLMGDFSPFLVPEPAPILLLFVGFGAAILGQRIKNK